MWEVIVFCHGVHLATLCSSVVRAYNVHQGHLELLRTCMETIGTQKVVEGCYMTWAGTVTKSEGPEQS